MKKSIFFIIIFLSTPQVWGHNFPSGFVPLEIVKDLNPTHLVIAPDGRIFLSEKTGAIRVIVNDVQLPESVIDIDVDSKNERGLQGLALHPDFAQNGWMYAYFAVPGANHNRVSRFTIQGNVAVQSSEVIIYELDASVSDSHNGGGMVFMDDGTLVFSTGDGGQSWAADLLNSTFGKVIRVHDDGSIPSDNPFAAETTGKYKAIYAIGLRNPFSMIKNPDSGQIFIGDVGNGWWEEVNLLVAGGHYGWDDIEGIRTNEPQPSNYQDPFTGYNHFVGCAITGLGYCPSTTKNLPNSFKNDLYVADYCEGFIHRYSSSTGELIGDFASNVARPVGLFWADDGSLYILTRGVSADLFNDTPASGSLWKVIYTGSEAPFIYQNPENTLVTLGESAIFSVGSVGKDPLTYEWFKNGQLLAGAVSDSLWVQNPSILDSGAVFHCIVENSLGRDTSASAELWVTSNQRPSLLFLAPDPNQTYGGGDTLFFAAEAMDPETGILPSDAMTWRISFHHDSHAHPALDPISGIESGFYPIPTQGESSPDVFYRVYLNATDPDGLSKLGFVDVQPDHNFTHLQAVPLAQTALSVNATERILPYDFKSVRGVEQSIEAKIGFNLGDYFYLFKNWSNGETAPRLVFISGTLPDSLTAIYDKIPMSKGTGLLGKYYEETPIPDFSTGPIFERIDTTIDFAWGMDSPDLLLRPDSFAVRWTGYIEPIFSDTTNFHIIASDGVRLIINGEIVIDNFVGGYFPEISGSVYLEAGKKYPIQLDYFDVFDEAQVLFSWSSPQMTKSIVPKRQLFNINGIEPATVQGFLWWDDNQNGLWESGEQPIEGAVVILHTAGSGLIVAAKETGEDGFYQFQVDDGQYYLSCSPSSTTSIVLPGTGFGANGESPIFFVGPNDTLLLKQAFSRLTDAPFEWTGNAQILSFSPNPGRSYLEIGFRLENDSDVWFEWYNEQGALVLDKKMFGLKSGFHSIDIASDLLPSGVYQVVLRTEAGRSIGLWVKE